MEWERLDISSKYSRFQGNISGKDGLDKGQKWHGPNRSRGYKEEVVKIPRRTAQKNPS